MGSKVRTVQYASVCVWVSYVEEGEAMYVVQFRNYILQAPLIMGG